MKRLVLLLMLAMTLAVAPTFADSLLVQTSAVGDNFPLVVDTVTAPAGFVTSTTHLPNHGSDFGGPSAAIAWADASHGFSAIHVDGIMWDGYDNWEIEALAETSLTATNNTGGDAQYTYDFALDDFGLWIADFSGFDSAEVYFEAGIIVDGISVFSANAKLSGGKFPTHTLEASGLVGAPVLEYWSDDMYGFIMGGFGDTLDLGIIADGDSVTIDTHLRAYIHTGGFEIGGRFQGGALHSNLTVDPLGPPNPDIPEPASLILLGMGALGMAAKRRFSA